MNMANKHTLKITGGVVLVIIILAVAYFFVFVRQTGEYSIVYLSTGEVYIGHLSTFPRLTLTDGYILQVVRDPVDPKKNTFQLNPLKDALWAPQYLYLNQDQVLFTGPLLETSNIYQTLKNPAANAAKAPAPSAAPIESTQGESEPE